MGKDPNQKDLEQKDPNQKDFGQKDQAPIQKGTEAIQPEAVVSREWKPTVRVKKREEAPRQKIRIKDLSPDKQYVKDVNDNELKYFLLVAIPVIMVAIVSISNRSDSYNKLVDLIVKFFSNS